MIYTFGWAIAGRFYDKLQVDGEDSAVLAVSCIRPFYTKEALTHPDNFGGRGEAITTSLAHQRFGNTLFPWSWESDDGSDTLAWSVYGFREGDSTGTKIEIGRSTELAEKPDTNDVEDVRATICKELADKTSKSQWAFSAHPDDAEAPSDPSKRDEYKSLVHAIAPLSHLGAHISSSTLRMGQAVLIKGDLSVYEMLVAFPTFKATINGSDVDFSPIDGSVEVIDGVVNGKSEVLVECKYSPLDENNEVKFVCEGVYLEEIDVEENDAEFLVNKEVKAGFRLAARLLDPIAIAIKTTDHLDEIDHATGKRWRSWLAKAMGAGWLYEFGFMKVKETERDHVFDSLVPDEELVGHYGADWEINVFGRAAWESRIPKAIETMAGTDSTTYLRPQRDIWTAFYEAGLADADLPAKNRKEPAKERIMAWRKAAEAASNMDIASSMQSMWHQHLAVQFKIQESSANLADLTSALAEYVDERQYERAKICTNLYGYDGGAAFDELLATFIHASISGDDAGAEAAREALIEWFIVALQPIQSDPTTIRSVLDGDNGCIGQFFAVLKQELDKKPVPRDDGLLIKIEDEKNQGEVSAIDDHIRGYAVALKCEIRIPDQAPQIVDRAWITDTAVSYQKVEDNDCSKVYEDTKYVMRDKSGGPLWTHESVGSAVIDGERLVELPFDGDAISAVLAIGKKVGAKFQYEFSVRSDVDYDDLEGIDYHWYLRFKDGDNEADGGRRLPGLGYGMWYSAAQTKIDNAGVIVGVEFRDINWPAQLKAIEDVSNWDADLGRYLSLEPPGAPSMLHKIDGHKYNGSAIMDRRFELSKETRAHEYLAATKEGRTPPIALLTPISDNTLFAHTATTYSLELLPPPSSREFVDRWLYTDESLRRTKNTEYKDLVSDEILWAEDADQDIEKIRNLRDWLSDTFESFSAMNDAKISDLGHRYHPAIEAIGLTVTWYPDGKEVKEEDHMVLPLKRLVDDGTTFRPSSIMDLAWTVEIVSTENASDDCSATISNSKVTVTVPPGAFASITSYCLVDKDFFGPKDESTSARKARFDEFLTEDGRMNPAVNFGKQHRAFSPTTKWFECAPNWDEALAARIKDSMLSVLGPTSTQRTSRSLIVDRNLKELEARWLRGMTIERHQWHWAGNPVDIPRQDPRTGAVPLDKFLIAMSGVGTFRETDDVVLATSFAKDRANNLNHRKWMVTPGQVLSKLTLQDVGTSSYDAFTAKPIARFRRWLSPNSARLQTLEKAVIAAGDIRLGPDPKFRPPSPILRWNFPLTSSFERQNDGGAKLLPERGRNGCLLVVDEAIRRTDDLAKIGGLGETLEVDVENTRPYCDPDSKYEEQRTEQSYKEAGVNPTIERLVDDSDPINPTLNAVDDMTIGDAFGLTYDTGRNPKIVQTGVPVFPIGAKGRWAMAKIRVRRVILPETLLSYDYDVGLTPLERSIDTRQEGEETIPSDFVIDCTEEDVLENIVISRENSDADYKIVVPTSKQVAADTDDSEQLPSTLARRFKVTWHKGRWDGANPPHWAPQVDLEKMDRNYLKWEHVSRVTPFEQDPFERVPEKPSVKIRPQYRSTPTKPPRIVKLHASDYSDSEWVKTIGMFGKEHLLRSDEYVIKKIDDGTDLRIEVAEKGKSSNVIPKCVELISSLEQSDDTDVVFNWLTIHAPSESVMHGQKSSNSGRRIAEYKPIASSDSGRFAKVKGDNTEDWPPGSFAILHSFHRIGDLARSKPNETNPNWRFHTEDGRQLRSEIKDWVSINKKGIWLSDDGKEEPFPESGSNSLEGLVSNVAMTLGPIPIES